MRTRTHRELPRFIALIAMMMAIVPATAAASEPQFEAESYPATITGEQGSVNQAIVLGGSPVTCENISFANGTTMNAEGSSLSAGPGTYSECTTFGFVGGTINPNGCSYGFQIGNKNFPSSMSVSCPAGKVIEINAVTCSAQIPPQTNRSSVRFVNNSADVPKRTVTARAEAVGITYTVTKDNFGCPLHGTGTFEDGALLGDTKLKAHSTSNPATKIGLSVTGLEPEPDASRFEAGGYPALISGEQAASAKHVIKLGGSQMTCNGSAVSGAIAGATSIAYLVPTYSECTAFGFVGATVNRNGCSYGFQLGESLEGSFPGSMSVACPDGRVIEINVATCKVEIPAQTGRNSVTFVNSETDSQLVTAQAAVSDLKYTVTKDGFLCPLKGTGSFEDGAVAGDTELRARANGNTPVDFWAAD